MDPRLQRRVQRYGWDRAAPDYELLWHTPLEVARTQLLALAALAPGERVLDVACGTGLVSFAAAAAVGPEGRVVGVDLSGEMVEAARHRARARQVPHASFLRMPAEQLDLPSAGFDVALCAFGLMYVPEPERAVRELQRVLRPGGRIVLAVWGERARCAWSSVFPIVEAEVASDVCPMFFHLGQADTLARLCAAERFQHITKHRLAARLVYASDDEACDAVYAAGPVAMAWSRFDRGTRARARARYLETLVPWRHGAGYQVPAEFVLVAAAAPPA